MCSLAEKFRICPLGKFGTRILNSQKYFLSMSTSHEISQGFVGPIGFFTAQTRVRISPSETKPIASLQAGDMVSTPEGNRQVLHLVEFNNESKPFQLLMSDNIRSGVTPDLPFRKHSSDDWHRPRDNLKLFIHEGYANTVYNLVLSNGSSFYCQFDDRDYNFCALAHGMTHPKVYHPFWGTIVVVHCMHRCSIPTKAGTLKIKDVDVLRNSEGEVNGLAYKVLVIAKKF